MCVCVCVCVRIYKSYELQCTLRECRLSDVALTAFIKQRQHLFCSNLRLLRVCSHSQFGTAGPPLHIHRGLKLYGGSADQPHMALQPMTDSGSADLRYQQIRKHEPREENRPVRSIVLPDQLGKPCPGSVVYRDGRLVFRSVRTRRERVNDPGDQLGLKLGCPRFPFPESVERHKVWE